MKNKLQNIALAAGGLYLGYKLAGNNKSKEHPVKDIPSHSYYPYGCYEYWEENDMPHAIVKDASLRHITTVADSMLKNTDFRADDKINIIIETVERMNAE